MPQASQLERYLQTQARMCGLPKPETQFCLVSGRKYRWDFAWPAYRLLVEVQGGTWSGGAHARGKGISRDCEKMNLAVLHGWQQMSFTSDQIKSGRAIEALREFFRKRETDAS
jgi:very-short-patch-repair endonuclease